MTPFNDEHRATRRQALRWLGGATGVALLAACSPSAPATSPAPTAASGAAAKPAATSAAQPAATTAPAAVSKTSTVKWWTLPSEDFSEESQRAMAAAFEAKTPNIKIEQTFLPADGYDQKVTTALGTGEGPDVMFFWTDGWLPKALDLSKLIQRDKFDISQYNEAAWNSWAKYGTSDKIIGLPLGVGANFLFYREDLFKQFGVTPPQWGVTMEQWLATVPKVTDKSKKIWGGDRPRGAFRSLFYSNGARLMSDDGLTVDGYFNSPASIAAYQSVWDLVATNATPTTADIAALGTAQTGPVDLFIAGRVASATLNQGHLANLKKAGVAFGTVNEPGWNGKDLVAHSWSLRVGINSATKDQDAAWEFLKFWAGGDGQRVLMQQGNLVPSWKPVLAEFPNGDDPNVKTLKKVLDQKSDAEIINKFPYYPVVLREAVPLWDKINLQQIKREEIATEVQNLTPALQAKLDAERKKLTA